MTIERIPVSQLSAAAYNPRKDLKPGDVEYEKLRRSIAEFGYVEPIVWNRRTGNVVGGHQRLKIITAGGAAEVDVSVVDLDEPREKALNIALNKISGEWDDSKLADLLAELQRDTTVDETLSGFDYAEIDKQLDKAVDESPAQSGRAAVKESYSLLVTCNGESDQEQLYRKFTDDGRDVRVLTMPAAGEKPTRSDPVDATALPASAIKVEVSCPVEKSFRVEQVSGMFDVKLEAKATRSWSVELPALDGGWKIGAIVGPSGSGKSQISRQVFGDGYVTGYEWPAGKAIVDAFPESLGISDITAALNAVGFSSPPDWVKPYAALSVGQQFRCNLARAILTPANVVAFDEFTSVVDRQVAQFGSAAVAKAIRAGSPAARFVAVTCHYDVLAWLQPDWVLDAGRLLRRGTREFAERVGDRPRIPLEIRRAPRRLWTTFEHHHYLSPRLHRQARCFAAVWDGRPIAFCAVIQNMGHKGRRIIHRLVVLPDYQGVGVGLRLLDAVAAMEARTHEVSIRTSHPALIRSLANRPHWRCIALDDSGTPHRGMSNAKSRRGSIGRSTASFEYAVGLSQRSTVDTCNRPGFHPPG